jgi:hypothetical protein
LTDGKFHNIGV